MTREEEIAWSAGLFEGEGCFTRSGNGSYLCCFMQSTDEDVVARFARIVGFGNLSARPYTRPGRKPIFQWQAYGFVKFSAVLDLFRPHLGHRRLARATELLEQESERRAAKLVRGG
jgi:hypothetical protein